MSYADGKPLTRPTITLVQVRARDLTADDLVVEQGRSWRITDLTTHEVLGAHDTVFCVQATLHRMAKREDIWAQSYDLDDLVTIQQEVQA